MGTRYTYVPIRLVSAIQFRAVFACRTLEAEIFRVRFAPLAPKVCLRKIPGLFVFWKPAQGKIRLSIEVKHDIEQLTEDI